MMMKDLNYQLSTLNLNMALTPTLDQTMMRSAVPPGASAWSYILLKESP
jgi:hypothetical protein